MVPYDLHLDERTLAEARRDGFDPRADIVPSALGVPESTGLSPDEYNAEVAQALELVQKDEHFIRD